MIPHPGSKEEALERVRKADEAVEKEWVKHLYRMKWGVITMGLVWVAVVLFIAWSL